MVHNRNKLLLLLAGNLANAVAHKVLEQSVKEENLRKKYDKESMVSYEIAKRYRKQINPLNSSLSEKDTEAIKEEIERRVRNELKIRVSKGYKGINFELIGPVTENLLKVLLIHAP